MVTVNNFSVQIPEGTETNDSYVVLRHATKYKLSLTNSKSVRCNAEVKIDGKHQGTWRIEAQDRIILERPANDQGKFTFYKLGSEEANTIQLTPNTELGLVKVIFTPELVRQQPEVTRSFRRSSQSLKSSSRGGGSGGMSAGGTGLSGHSEQNYGRAERMELDESEETVIHLRLVVANEEEDKPRPLRSFSNPVPPPLC